MSTLAELISLLNTANCIDANSASDLLHNIICDNIRITAEPDCRTTSGDGEKEVISETGGNEKENIETEKNEEKEKSKIFLLSIIHKGHCNKVIQRECNGVVLRFDASLSHQWSPLVIPPRVLVNSYPANFAKVIRNYVITEIDDGTVISLYWHNEWRLATARGSNMGNQKWASTKTYNEILDEVFQVYGVDRDKLAKDICYTIGYHHPDHHPFTNDIHAWNICCFHAETMTPVENPMFLSVQRTLKSTKIGERILSDINRMNKNAIHAYLTTGVAHYGYVLRNSETSTDIVLESNLYRHIKETFYDQPRTYCANEKQRATNDLIMRMYAENDSRYNFIAMRAYVRQETRGMTLNLFPQFAKKFREFDTLLNDIALKILCHLHDSTSILAIADLNAVEPTQLAINNIMKLITVHIKKIGGISPMLPESKGIVLDFLLEQKYVIAYAMYITERERGA